MITAGVTQAEALSLSRFRVESHVSAQDGQLIGLSGVDGTVGSAKGTFSGADGSYVLKLAYWDESDGEAGLAIKVDGVVLDTWTLNQKLGSAGVGPGNVVVREIPVTLASGALIEIVGVKDGGEAARIDYIALEPVSPPPPEEDALRIMALGDSITYGVVSRSSTETGGYRTFLADYLEERDVPFDFVGSLSNGPASLSDDDHEGHRGRTINWLNDNDEAFIEAARPDVVLLMAGTNDTRGDTLQTMLADMQGLIASITAQDPNIRLLVSEIPPIRTEEYSVERAQLAEDFNAMLPDLVAAFANQGHHVRFVTQGDLTVSDITSPPNDSGLHPTVGGYEKIAANWLEGLAAFGLVPGSSVNTAMAQQPNDSFII